LELLMLNIFLPSTQSVKNAPPPQSVTVEVRPDEDATLLCSNYTSSSTQILWFRVVKRSEPNKIASIFDPSKVDSFENGKFEVTSNISHIFLKIKQVNVSDSGLYFCGFLMQQKTVIVHPTYLDIFFQFCIFLQVKLTHWCHYYTLLYFIIITFMLCQIYSCNSIIHHTSRSETPPFLCAMSYFRHFMHITCSLTWLQSLWLSMYNSMC
uniref:Ig-like domain-containing protein n=1 Tax=Sphaeramia orbicularis TaxID=375764 RepID=A0A673CHV0_9TELE